MKENFRRFKKERESKKKVYYDIVQCLENTIPKIENPYWHSQYYYCAISLLMLSYSKRLKVVKSY